MPTAQPQTHMRTVLRQWRIRRQISTIPGIEKVPPHLYKNGNLTQAVMAILLNTDERYYRRLEAGKEATGRSVSVDLVERTAFLLELNDSEREALFVWCGHRPPPRPKPNNSKTIPPELLSVLHHSGHGAYWSGAAYSVLTYNHRASWHWPWMQRPGANIMLELLTPGSQGFGQCLDWETEWAPHLITQLRRSIIMQPEDPYVQAVAEKVRESKFLRRVWDTDVRAELAIHAYGTYRPMKLELFPECPVWVCVQALVSMTHPGLRLVTGVLQAPEPSLPVGPPPPPTDEGPVLDVVAARHLH